jgi:hypothetical protein
MHNKWMIHRIDKLYLSGPPFPFLLKIRLQKFMHKKRLVHPVIKRDDRGGKEAGFFEF